MANIGGANRIELESQILSAALRQSRTETDSIGVALACKELSHLYPDLLPSPTSNEASKPPNYYELLQIDCDVNPSMVAAAHFKAIKQFLRENPDLKSQSEHYYQLLNAGFVLRKPRLRMSHDMILARETVEETSFEPTDANEASVNLSRTESLPLLVELLNHVNAIGPPEVQALKNQWSLYPDIPLVDLVLLAGYVTENDMKSLQLAEYLLSSGKITKGQFAAGFSDQNETGYWWPKDFPPEDPFEPFDASPVPKRPYPSAGSGSEELRWPDPDPETNTD